MHVIAQPVHCRLCDFSSRGWQAARRVLDRRDRLAPTAQGEAHRVILVRGAETHARSVLKAVSWRTLGTLDTFAISWFMTGRVEVAGSIAGLEIITKIAWYYLHERLWALVSWGRR
jgi:uncharacterized membrane protein